MKIKFGADDQNNQLKDYSQFLERESQGEYLLLYLNPYGLEPKTKSIGDKLKESLIQQNKVKNYWIQARHNTFNK